MPNYNASDLKTVQQYRAICERIPDSRTSSWVVESILEEPKPVVDAIIAILDPTTDKPQLPPEIEQRATEVIDNLEAQQRSVSEARLKRIGSQDEIEPFETVVKTELAYGFSNQTLTNAKLVTPDGVGIAYGSLLGLLEDLDHDDPEAILPSGYLDRPIATTDGEPLAPTPDRTLSQHFAGENGDLESEDILTGRDLIEQTSETRNSLRYQLKYVRDCFFLRHLHKPLCEILDDPDVPQLVWTQAAVDVQNDDDPFSVEPSNEDDSVSVPTEKLYRQNHLPPHLQDDNDGNGNGSDGQATQTANTSAKQTGLGQF